MRLSIARISTYVACMVLSLFCSSSRYAFRGRDVSPFEFGLKSAKTDEERYNVIYETHKAAVAAGVNVDYTGIDSLRIEITAKSSRIPLTRYNDFKGCVFVVRNTAKKAWLFDCVTTESSITIDKSLIDDGDFRSIDVLHRGRFLLIIEDENLWVSNRSGHSYGHTRKDILLLENGVAKNAVTMPYNNDNSFPKCTYVRLDGEPLIIKNLNIERDSRCDYLTNIALISGHDDVRITNIKLFTPPSKLSGDRGFLIRKCTNVTFEDVRIEGTYSQIDQFGYGINLDNIWNFYASRLYGRANWGIFGNNNLNTVRIEDSHINRFDIHCYGKDVMFKEVTFFDGYNQYASVYGTIAYDKCIFTDFVPVLNGGSYNSYVGHEVIFHDCIFNVTREMCSLLKMSYLNRPKNTRQELASKCLPNLRIKNLTVNMKSGADEFYLFYCSMSGLELSFIDYLSDISIDGLKIVSDGTTPVKTIALSNIPIKTVSPVRCSILNMDVEQPEKGKLVSSQGVYVRLKANITLSGGGMILKNLKNVIIK